MGLLSSTETEPGASQLANLTEAAGWSVSKERGEKSQSTQVKPSPDPFPMSVRVGAPYTY